MLVAVCTAALLVGGVFKPLGAVGPTPRSPIPRVPTRCRRCMVRRWRTRSIWPMPPRRSRPGGSRRRRSSPTPRRPSTSDHFAREADLIGFGGDIAANLRDAISGETNEVNTMYPGFAKQATADNDPAAASPSPRSAPMRRPTSRTSRPH